MGIDFPIFMLFLISDLPWDKAPELSRACCKTRCYWEIKRPDFPPWSFRCRWACVSLGHSY